MDIQITYGIGTGATSLSAFDSALFNAGIANFNLIKLSSIIPPHSNINIGRVDLNNYEIGSKLFAVYTSYIISENSEKACAGLGWKHDNNGGIFVEYSAGDRQQTHAYIESSLNSMNKYRKIKSDNNIKIVESSCIDNKPTCTIIAAIYKIESWR